MRKVLTMVLLEKLKAQVEPRMSEEEAGFRKDKNTIQQILILRGTEGKKKGKKGVSLLHRLSKGI